MTIALAGEDIDMKAILVQWYHSIGSHQESDDWANTMRI
jgi:hypothetical protein